MCEFVNVKPNEVFLPSFDCQDLVNNISDNSGLSQLGDDPLQNSTRDFNFHNYCARPPDEQEENLHVITFIQSENCYVTSKDLPQCLECSKDPNTYKYTCRFYDFRKLSRHGSVIRVAGFLNPQEDPTSKDLAIWNQKENMRIDMTDAVYILKFATFVFCELAMSEKKIQEDFQGEILWKRPVLQTREQCDVCSTSLFNLHWTCTYCGANACLDCHRERSNGTVRWKPKTKADKEQRDRFFWLKCNAKSVHNLVLTQIIPDSHLQTLNEQVHIFCKANGIEMKCLCELESNMISRPVNSNDRFSFSMKRQRYRCRTPKQNKSATVCYSVGYKHIAGGRLVKFLHADESPEALILCQDQNERGLPFVVAKADNKMNKKIWTPDYFSKRFGNVKHCMIDCKNGQLIKNVAMKIFWDGFESINNRIPKDSQRFSDKTVLKLKDWPTSDDFANVIKEHFDDMMGSVPMSPYTTRNGIFNLARYLPNFFSRPDLGPKMYCAYAQSLSSTQGSTNLHLDVSDAVNVMIHRSRPKDYNLLPEQYSNAAMIQALKQAGADAEDIANVENDIKLPGAIWHIWESKQADGIRKLLKKESTLKGLSFSENDDPIHDQNCYIDQELRLKLEEESIRGYTIVQYEGDAVFIPAGAPHQVLNILDCIKVALDFVGPENLVECVNLTEEFRILSKNHQNHEDKLQIKNILHHTLKNLVSVDTEI